MKKLIVIVAVLFFVRSVHAQTVELSMTPPQTAITIKPGNSATQAFSVRNDGDTGRFVARVVSFVPEGQQGGRRILDGNKSPLQYRLENSNYALNSPFVIERSKTVQLIVKIDAPQGIDDGDHYSMLVVESEPSITQNTASRSSVGIAANILVAVSNDGNVILRPDFAQLQVIPTYSFSLFGSPVYIFEPSEKIPVVVQVVNKGTTYLNPMVSLTVRGGGYEEKQELVPVTVLAQSQRLLTTSQSPCDTCKTPVSAVFSSGFWGKYILSAQLGVEENNEKIYGSLVYWVFPLKMTGIILLITLAGAGLLLVRKGMKKR